MWPLGTYDRMVHEIKHHENPDIPVTFGILIADCRQSLSKEYILNYINRFNYKSDRYINFYLPGYLEEQSNKNNEIITIDDKEHYFDWKKYDEFVDNLVMDFHIAYPYNPVLLLLEYNKGHFSKSKKIYIELDSDGLNIKKTGELFEKIFELSKKHISLKDISGGLTMDTLKSGLFDRIVKGIDNKLISAIRTTGKDAIKYRIKD